MKTVRIFIVYSVLLALWKPSKKVHTCSVAGTTGLRVGTYSREVMRAS
jgi:hypothetical protein